MAAPLLFIKLTGRRVEKGWEKGEISRTYDVSDDPIMFKYYL